MTKFRKLVASLSIAGVLLSGAACSDDDNDGNPEVNVPEVDVNKNEDKPGD